jgi:hypothetical protein
MNRVAWDLRFSTPYAVGLNSETPELGDEPSGMLAVPGNYSATLAKEVGGEITTLSAPVNFEVVPLREGALKGSSPAEAAKFWRSYEETVRNSSAVSQMLDKELARVEATRTALSRASASPGELDERLAHLFQLTQECLTENRLGFDHKPLRPHITLGRIRKTMKLKKAFNQPTNIRLQVDKIALYQSTLTDAGSIYLALKEIELGQTGNHPV